MTVTAAALLGYVAWTIVLVFVLAGMRSALVMRGVRASNDFSASGEDLEGFGRRATRAYSNATENLPVAGALMLYAIATGQTALTDPLAGALLAARILQSTCHLASTSKAAVMIRFAFYVAQLAISLWWLFLFASAL